MNNSLLVAVVVVLFSQGYCQFKQCTCAVMDGCVQTESVKKTSCVTDCAAATLTTGGSKAQQCIVDVSAAHSKASATANQCVETLLGRACTTTTRARRAAVAHHPHGGHGGVGGGPFGNVRLTGVAQTEFAQFQQCVFQCLTANANKNQPKPAAGNPQGEARGRPMGHQSGPFGGPRGGPFGQFGGPVGGPYYGECPKQNNCFLPQPDFSKNPTGVQNCFKAQMETSKTTEQTFCTCLQGAYTADTVLCNFPTGK